MREIKFLLMSSIALVILSMFLFGCLYPLLTLGMSTAIEAVASRTQNSKRNYRTPSFEELVQLVSYRTRDIYFSPRPSSWDRTEKKNLFFSSEGSSDCLYEDCGKSELAKRASLIGLPLDIAFDSRYNDMITESASGIDPHISPYNAHFQADRVARLRGIDPAQLHLLIDECTLKSGGWALFPSVVDVFVLNNELDLRFPQK